MCRGQHATLSAFRSVWRTTRLSFATRAAYKRTCRAARRVPTIPPAAPGYRLHHTRDNFRGQGYEQTAQRGALAVIDRFTLFTMDRAA